MDATLNACLCSHKIHIVAPSIPVVQGLHLRYMLEWQSPSFRCVHCHTKMKTGSTQRHFRGKFMASKQPHLLCFGIGFLGSEVCRVVVQHGGQVTGTSTSGTPVADPSDVKMLRFTRSHPIRHITPILQPCLKFYVVHFEDGGDLHVSQANCAAALIVKLELVVDLKPNPIRI
jgi:hypothetical protein